MKKILFVHHGTGWGGAPKAMINLINSLDKSKYDTEVLLLKKSIVTNKLEENGIKYRLAKSNFYRKYYTIFIHSEAGYYQWYQFYYIIRNFLFWILSRFLFARKELKNFDYDIVHLNSSVLSDWLAPASAKGKVVIHIREPFKKRKLDIFYYIFTEQMRKYANVIIAISKDNLERIGLENKSVVVYDYSVKALNIPPESSYYSKKVLYLGGSQRIKGFYEMVEALDFIDKDILVYFAGNYTFSHSNRKIKRFVKLFITDDKKKENAIIKMRESNKAIEIGLIYDVPKYLNEVCCLVSPFDKPHFSLPVVEALTNRKPVIVTNIDGADEIIKDKINGLIIPKNNPQELANAINYMCKNGDLAREMGENGFLDAVEKFSITNMEKIAEIYDGL